MKPNRKPHLILAAVSAMVAMALLAPAAGAAQKVPPLVSTPQYKAFVQFVAKLRDESGKPHTAGQKATYESQLTNKHSAAANRANGLFQRSKQIAKTETQARFQAAAKKIRVAEKAELADLRAEYNDKMDAATQLYQRSLGSTEDRYNARYVSIQKQVKTLRMQKAKANSQIRKDQIQNQINNLIKEESVSRIDEKEAIEKLKKRYSEKKKAIRAGKAADTAEIVEKRQAGIDALRSRWNRVYNTKLEDLRDRRTSQLTNLEGKLVIGRAAIASMPVGS